MIDADGSYQGVLRLQDTMGQNDISISHMLHQDWPRFDENTSLWQAMDTIEGFVGEAVPVVSSNDNRLLGMITEAQLITAYLKIAHELREEENEAV